MPRRILKILWLLASCVLTACAALIPSEYLITQSSLSEKLKATFPLHRNLVAGLFSATLEMPDIAFFAAQNRISLEAGFTATSIASRGASGRFLLTSGLRYDAKQRAIFLEDVHVVTVQIEQEDALAEIEILKHALNVMLNMYIKENPLYRFKPDELNFAGAEIDITGTEVVERGIKLKLKPKRLKQTEQSTQL